MLKLVFLFACVALAASLLPGGYSDVDVDDEGVVIAASHATKALGKQFSTPFHTKLAKIHKAKQQVVAGMNYKLDLTVGLTECKKAEVDFEDIETCEFQDNVSTYRKCTVVVYRDLKDNYKLTSSGCILTEKPDVE